MPIILNIETSSKICSVAVSKDGQVEFQLEDREGMAHASRLAPFVDQAMSFLRKRGEKPDAVAVSLGPGSYTGLRIGLSLAKGLAFSLDVPLIGVNTLELLAVKTMFRPLELTGDEILVPMIDARRMEVYTAAYDFALRPLMDPQPLIVTPEAYDTLPAHRKRIYLGDGSQKALPLLQDENSIWIDGVMPLAKDMTALAEKAWRDNKYIDLAYSVPLYLKDYQTTVSKKNVLASH